MYVGTYYNPQWDQPIRRCDPPVVHAWRSEEHAWRRDVIECEPEPTRRSPDDETKEAP